MELACSPMLRQRQGRLSAKLVTLAWAALALAGCVSEGPSETPRVGHPWNVLAELPEGTALPYLSSDRETLALSYVAEAGDTAGHRLLRLFGGYDQELARGGDWFVNWADIPKAELLRGGGLYAHVLARSGAGTYDYSALYDYRPARAERITDGRGGETAARLHEHDGPGEHGFVSWLELPGDSVLAVWLDGRATAAATGEGAEGHAGHDDHHGEGGAMQLRARALRGGRPVGEELLVDARVCDCCPTELVATANGPMVVYRDRSDGGEVRDLYRAFPLRPGVPPAPVRVDAWEMPGCPVNGPAAAASPDGRRVLAIGYTAAGGDGAEAAGPRLWAALSEDGGLNFGAAELLDGALPLGRADATVLPDGRFAVVYLGGASRTGRAPLVYAELDGATVSAREVVDSVSASRASGIPRVAVDPIGRAVVVAFTRVDTAGQTRVVVRERG